MSPCLRFDVANTIVKMYNNIQDVRKCGGLLWFRGMKLNCYYISRPCLEVECSKRLDMSSMEIMA